MKKIDPNQEYVWRVEIILRHGKKPNAMMTLVNDARRKKISDGHGGGCTSEPFEFLTLVLGECLIYVFNDGSVIRHTMVHD